MSSWNRFVRRILVLGCLVTALGAQPLLAAPTSALVNGSTSVQLSSDFVTALTSLNVTPASLRNATLSNGVASFPISGGAIDLGAVSTEIIHQGGLSLSANGTVVELTDFLISNLNGTPVLTGLVTVNEGLLGRVPLFALGLAGGPLAAGRLVTLRNVDVTLTPEAATALNQVFGVTAFTAGFPIGTATVNALTSGK